MSIFKKPPRSQSWALLQLNEISITELGILRWEVSSPTIPSCPTFNILAMMNCWWFPRIICLFSAATLQQMVWSLSRKCPSSHLLSDSLVFFITWPPRPPPWSLHMTRHNWWLLPLGSCSTTPIFTRLCCSETMCTNDSLPQKGITTVMLLITLVATSCFFLAQPVSYLSISSQSLLLLPVPHSPSDICINLEVPRS